MTATAVATEPRLHLSGWCSPPGRLHTGDHAKCQRRVDAGELTCDCPDHTTTEDAR